MFLRAIVCCVLVTACGIDSHAVEVHPGDVVELDDVNGDVGCDGGTAYLPANAVINGSLDATNCVLKIMGTVNGSITVSGGMVHVVDSPSVNGTLQVSDAAEVIVSESNFNGGAAVDHTAVVRILSSSFNGDGELDTNGRVDVQDNLFNGSLAISGSGSCVADNNATNGTLTVANCR